MRMDERESVIWLVLMWLALIVLWGAWDLAAVRRHAAQAAQHLHHHRAAHPFDWANGPRR